MVGVLGALRVCPCQLFFRGAQTVAVSRMLIPSQDPLRTHSAARWSLGPPDQTVRASQVWGSARTEPSIEAKGQPGLQRLAAEH